MSFQAAEWLRRVTQRMKRWNNSRAITTDSNNGQKRIARTSSATTTDVPAKILIRHTRNP